MRIAPLITTGCVVALCGLVYLTGGKADAHQQTTRALAQLGRGDFGAAADTFASALGELEAGAPDYDRARMGLVEALAHIEPERARLEFLAYADSGAELDARDYLTVSSTLHKEGGSTAAAQLLDAAISRFPADEGRLERQKATIVKQAESSATPEELERLRSLGYVGG